MSYEWVKVVLLFILFVTEFTAVIYLNIILVPRVVPRFGPPYYRLFWKTCGRNASDRGTKAWQDAGFTDQEIKIIQRRQDAAVIQAIVGALMISPILLNVLGL
jgi:hypothetical protein